MSDDALLVDPRDEIFDQEEAAAFARMSPSLLERSNAPVASMAREEGKRGRKLYLRSQLILWVLTRTMNRINPAPIMPKLRRHALERRRAAREKRERKAAIRRAALEAGR